MLFDRRKYHQHERTGLDACDHENVFKLAKDRA